MPKAYALNNIELNDFFKNEITSSEQLNILINNIYRSRSKDITKFSQLPQKLIDKYNLLDNQLPTIIKKQVATDGTIKFLVQLKDRESVEMVLLPFYKKFTLCVSSQVGCAMGCKFCFTATQGYKRNLSVDEIIGQVLLAKEYIKENNKNKELTNIVFMGQGEPLHNFDQLKKSIHILTMRNGLSISERNITVSTVGYIPGLKRYKELKGVNLALSLHAVNEEKRGQIIPLNQKYPLSEISKVIDSFSLNKKQTIEYEYLLIKDFNDSDQDAKDLANFLENRTHMINIIPFNPFPGSDLKKPSKEDAYQFKEKLVQYGLRSMVRTTKGDDILAACGQLNSKKETK
jgi:23S rRNA (adenine2503-C2)-methyltransferase